MDVGPSSSGRVNRLVCKTVLNVKGFMSQCFGKNPSLFQDEAILKDSLPNTLCQNIAKFATTTSAHGFAYTVEGATVRRVVSTVIVVAFVAVAGNFTYSAIRFLEQKCKTKMMFPVIT